MEKRCYLSRQTLKGSHLNRVIDGVICANNLRLSAGKIILFSRHHLGGISQWMLREQKKTSRRVMKKRAERELIINFWMKMITPAG